VQVELVLQLTLLGDWLQVQGIMFLALYIMLVVAVVVPMMVVGMALEVLVAVAQGLAQEARPLLE
jgi:hypothetical protein